MADFKRVYNQRYLILIWSVVEVLLFSAIVYGWAALVIVLKQEKFFHDLCEAKHDVDNNSTAIVDECIVQDERLNLVFLAGVISFSGSGLVSGAFLDRFGPRKTRLLSSFLYGLTFLFFALADKDRPNLIFPGIITLSMAGLTLFLTTFQVANMFNKWKSSVISLFNGALDSSAIVLLFFKLIYDAGIPLRSIYIFYFLFAITASLVFTFVLPPYSITSERIEMDSAGDFESSRESMQHEFAEDPLVRIQGAHGINGTTKVDGNEIVNGEMKTPEKSGRSQHDETDLELSPLCRIDSDHDKNGEVKVIASSKDPAPRILSLMMSLEYMMVVLYLSVCNLRLWFYVGNLNSYLEFMSDNDMDTVSHYTNWFGIAQFAGFIVSPFVGFVMDWKPKKKENNEKTDIGFVLGFFLTSFVALLLNILVLVPVLSVQYVSFVAQVVLRAFAYAVYSAFLLHKFPMCHFGKLYGAGHLISSALGATQYGLFTIAEETLEKDPFWVNVGLLVLCLFLNILPTLLWFKERKQDRKTKPVVRRIIIK